MECEIYDNERAPSYDAAAGQYREACSRAKYCGFSPMPAHSLNVFRSLTQDVRSADYTRWLRSMPVVLDWRRQFRFYRGCGAFEGELSSPPCLRAGRWIGGLMSKGGKPSRGRKCET